jgi:hypothetical protein
MILHSLLDTKYLLAEDMGAEPESRYVRAACPSVLDCLSCGGFSGSLWAGSGLLSLSWLVALSALSLTSHSLWPGLAASCFLFVVLFLLLFVSPSICVSLSPLLSAFSLPLFAVFLSGFLLSFAALFCSLRFSSVLLLFSFRYDFLLSFYYFRFAMIFFCLSLRSPIFFLRSSIFLFLRSSIFFPCDLLFSFSCDLPFSFPAIFYFPFPGFRAGFYLALGFTQAGMNVRGFAPAGFVPGRSPWTGSRSRHLRPPTFYSISWWRSRGPAASSGVPPLLCAALARLSPFPHVIM